VPENVKNGTWVYSAYGPTEKRWLKTSPSVGLAICPWPRKTLCIATMSTSRRVRRSNVGRRKVPKIAVPRQKGTRVAIMPSPASQDVD
jgi:hypothetical protein